MEVMGLSCWEGALSAAVVHNPSCMPATLTGYLGMRVEGQHLTAEIAAAVCMTVTAGAMESCVSCAVSAQRMRRHRRAVCGCVVLASEGALPCAGHLGTSFHTAWRAHYSVHASLCFG